MVQNAAKWGAEDHEMVHKMGVKHHYMGGNAVDTGTWH